LRTIRSRQYRNRLGETDGLKLLLAGILAMALAGMAAEDKIQPLGSGVTKQRADLPEVELRGRMVCLPEAMHELYQTDLPANHAHVPGFKTVDGIFYTLLRTKLSEALFVDKRLGEKELILRGHVLPKTQMFEMTGMKSVRNGAINDLYYYCEVCAIKTLAPGPCMCCQGPVKLVEKPLH
jgi:hypothetical protein